MRYCIGIDIGTTNVKAVALDDAGRLLASAQRRNRTFSPQPGFAEQDPLAAFRLVVDVVKQVTANCSGLPACLVFSGAMHSLIALDAAGRPLINAWIWSDRRAAAESESLRVRANALDIYQRTGTPLHPMSPLCKIIWLRQNRPDVFAQTHILLGIKEFVWFKIFDQMLMDCSLASATGLLNLVDNCWDAGVLQVAGINETRLPSIVPPAETFFLPAKNPFGLPGGIPALPGASDGALANLGSGAADANSLAISIGTSAAVRILTDGPATDAAGLTFCYRLDTRRFVLGGASNNGANTLEWWRDKVLQSRRPVPDLLDAAAETRPGAEGLLFLPYLDGERAPLWDAAATGSFQGLRAQHIQAHCCRAVLEGVALNLKLIAASLPAAKQAERLVASGGAIQSPLWLQILADVFEKPLVTPLADAGDASVRGAIMLAREALALPALPRLVFGKTIQPRSENLDIYRAAFERFTKLCNYKN